MFGSSLVRQMLRTFAEKLAGTKPLPNVERSFRRKDGTLMQVQLDDQLLNDPSGRIIGIRATMQDITERKRAEAERLVIAEIVQSVITTANLDELFKLAHQAITKILPAESCFIALRGPYNSFDRAENAAQRDRPQA